MKEIYKTLLERAYELEGLLSIALSREEVPEELERLIERKIEELRLLDSHREEKPTEETLPFVEEDCREFEIESEPDLNPELETSLKEEVEETSLAPDSTFDENEKQQEGTFTDEMLEEFILKEEDFEASSELETEVREKVEEPERKEDGAEIEDLKEEEAEIEEETGNDENIQEKETIGDLEDEAPFFYALNDEDEKEEPEAASSVIPEPIRKEKRRKPKFSLNDRFLFIRELYRGDAKAFNADMEKLSDIASYTEAEKYFTESLALNPEENSTHEAFLNVIAKYY